MSRLYCWIDTDSIKTTHTARAHENIRIQINYGSKENSKPLCTLNVSFPKNTEKPKIEFERRV